MHDGHGNPGRFTRLIRDALQRSGFATPAADEACALLVDLDVFAGDVAAAAASLDPIESGRAARYRFDRDRTAYVLSHAVWRVALAECLGVEPMEVRLTGAVSGQPRLPGTMLSTSMSRSGNRAAIAICAGATVGIDIERAPPRVALDGLLETICTPAEAEGLRNMPPPTREQALLALWTRKEALLKAFGVGLVESPSALPAEEGRPVEPPARAVEGLPACRVMALDSSPGLVGALALPVGARFMALHRLPPRFPDGWRGA